MADDTPAPDTGESTEVRSDADAPLDSDSLRAIFHSVNDAIFVHDGETGEILDVNETMCEMYGYSRAEALQLTVEDLSSGEEPYTQENAVKYVRKAANGEPQVYEWHAKDSNGDCFWVEVSMRRAIVEDDLYIIVIVRDITTRKEREQELDKLSTRLELALEETDTGVWEWDLETDEVTWDETSERLFGYPPGAFPGDFAGFADRIPDDDLEHVQQQIDHAIETGDQYRADFRVQPPDGDQRWVQARGVVKHDDGEPQRLLGIQTDITDRKESERALEQAREELRQIIDLIPDPLYAKSRDDVMLLSNDANAALHGLSPEEIEGTREREIESEVENIQNFDKYRQREIDVMDTGEARTFEEELLDPDRQQHIFRTTRLPVETVGTDEDAVLGYARDVTPLKEHEQQLEATNKKLDKFASMVSHDLRNPLMVILGRVRHMDVREANESHLDAIERSATRMEDIISDLLALSRAGQEIDETETVPLATVVEESWDTVRPGGAELELDVPESVTVDADRDRLMNVFENLFRNTREHNDPPLTVRVGLLEATNEDTEAVSGFYIEDDGDGIAVEERDDVFNQGYTTNSDGTGFGLSIVEEVVESHDWTINIADSDAGGARFEITGVEAITE